LRSSHQSKKGDRIVRNPRDFCIGCINDPYTENLNVEIETLRTQVAKLEIERDMYKAANDINNERVAKLTEEREVIRKLLLIESDDPITDLLSEIKIHADWDNWSTDKRIRLGKQLTAAEARISELESAIEEGLQTYHVPTTARICEALSRKSNLDALEAHRDEVLEEAANRVEAWLVGSNAATAIRHLKKGKV
jgi:hypothetical protein